MFPSRPENPWNPAQQPGLGICHRFTVSNGVPEEPAPKAAAIATAIEFGRCDMYRGAVAAASEAVSLSL